MKTKCDELWDMICRHYFPYTKKEDRARLYCNNHSPGYFSNIVAIPDKYFELRNKFYEWTFTDVPKRFHAEDARQLAELICPMGYFVYFEKASEFIQVTQIVLKNIPNPKWSFNDFVIRNTYSPGGSIFYYSSNFHFPNVDLTGISWSKETVEYTNSHFCRDIIWQERKAVFLLAARFRNGSFFHILKWIALFL